MLSPKFIRENKKVLEKTIQDKGIKLDLNKLLKVEEEKREKETQLNELQRERNLLGQKGKKGKPTLQEITQGKKLKQAIAKLEKEIKKTKDELLELMVCVPTIPSDDTPIGKDSDGNKEISRFGKPKKFDFAPKSHIELGESLDLLDFDRGVKVAGYRGYYLKNEGVLLQMGLMMFALKKLVQKGFTPMIPPTLVKEFVLFGSGYFKGTKYNSNTDEIYRISSENEEKLPDGSLQKESRFLIGTAEPSLLAYYAGEVLEEKNLPLKICGFSPCYRSEIGSYGKDTKGIYRVHEFMKIEQVCLAKADIKESNKLHQEMLEISKELHKDLGLPFRQIQICTGDMGSPGKYKQFDLEAWMPSRSGYGETGSASNFLDWQARRLNVQYRDKKKEKKFVFMLNNTALPSARIIIAILENYQQKDGSVVVPKVLREYIGKDLILPPKK